MLIVLNIHTDHKANGHKASFEGDAYVYYLDCGGWYYGCWYMSKSFKCLS